MKLILILAIVTVILALTAYSIGVLSEQFSKKLTKNALLFITMGVGLDIIATILMIVSSGKIITIHGYIGYSALLLMLVDAYFTWRLYLANGLNTAVPLLYHRYTRFAYIWWVAAFITGGFILR
ncbi:MAG: hypothetical protein KKD74_12505 [Bacteroidetes bacterium]|nr:hypothetical protein [Bacteroidota bacterium]